MNRDKISLTMEKLKHFDNINKNLLPPKNLKSSFKPIFLFFSVSFIGIFSFILNIFFSEFSYFPYVCMLSLLTFLIQMQLAQIFIFMTKIQHCLKILNEFEISDSEDLFSEYTKAFVKLLEINTEVNIYIQFPLLLSLAHVYLSILINFYWFFISILKSSLYLMVACLSFIIPCFIILFLLLYHDHQSRRIILLIQSKSTKLLHFFNGAEGFSMLQFHCKFTYTAFGIFETSAASVGQVSST